MEKRSHSAIDARSAIWPSLENVSFVLVVTRCHPISRAIKYTTA